MSSVDFIAIGHITHDVVEHGYILGGPAFYSAITARNLGNKVGVITNFGKDFHEQDLLDGLEIRYRVCEQTTTFQNIYDGHRKQIVSGVADPIGLEQIPEEWKDVPAVYICPVANEIRPELIRMFKSSLVGIGAQGWMRTWDEKGEVHPKRWENFKDILPYADVLFFSEEDIAGFGEGIIKDYIPIAKIVILTRGENGSTLFFGGERYNISAFPTNEVEPTGAGDVFGSAFLVKYKETGDPIKSAQFASVTASFVVEKKGSESIPILEQVLEREELYHKLDALNAIVS